MSSTHSSSTARISSSVFVQVPPSPFDLDHYQSLPPKHVPASSNTTKPLKENTPLHLQMLQSASALSSSLKRKLSDRDSTSTLVDVAPSSSKKAKSASTGTPLKLSQINSPTRPLESTSNACPEYPNGWTYCHQCCKKRDLDATIHCTYIEEKHVGKKTAPMQRRCLSKYCRPCLQNRYGVELDTLKNNRKWETGHIENAGYAFKCPKCRDECNCPRCRKSKGLDPIGIMKRPETASAKKERRAKNQSASAQLKKRIQKSKPKTLPAVKWTRIAPELSRLEAEERMHIREFVLRFNTLSNSCLPKTHLEELEQINGKYSGQEGTDPTSWVGDACVKSTILMLLGIFSADDSPFARVSQVAMKNLRSAGFSLTKLWTVLAGWQESIAEAMGISPLDDESNDSFSIAEPLPSSEYFWVQARRSTRTMTSAPPNSMAVYTSAQMVPVILSLIDLALRLPSVREALEEGFKESKELTRKAREALKIEGERWDMVKKQQDPKDKAGFQAAKRLHKDIVSALESSPAIAQYESMQRFAALGSDPEGRVFYALSPGHVERKAAYEFAEILSGEGSTTNRKLKKGRTLKPTEREDRHDWSWMILVWGKKPPSAFSPAKDEKNGNGGVEMDEESEAWWCFSEPEDIRQLAEWIALNNDLEEKGASGPSAIVDNEKALLKQLVASLKDFGSLLEWRLREDKYQLPPVGLKAVATSANRKAK